MGLLEKKKNSNLTAATLTVTNWSNCTGYNNTLNNISNTNLTNNSGSYTHLYGATLRYDTLVPSGGYITNDVNNTNTTSTNINTTNISSTGIHYSITSNISIKCIKYILC